MGHSQPALTLRPSSRAEFLRLDAEDPLAPVREEFDLPAELIYLDGNSLGAMPREARNRLSEATTQWAHGLISSWNDAGWAEAPTRVGDKIGRLLGARPSEVVMGDNTSVNLYKALNAALSLHRGGAILTDEQNFPTDLYVAEAVAKKWGVELRRVPRNQLGEAIQHGVAVVTATHVDYRTGHMLEMREFTKAAHDAGALFVWDLCHSAGAVPLDLNGADADLAVGCTYKFLNGGPGAPAYFFAARRLHGDLNNPIPGWFGHDHPFDFDSGYRPAPDARRFLTGTPAILSVAALEAAIDLWLTIDIALVRSSPGRGRRGRRPSTPGHREIRPDAAVYEICGHVGRRRKTERGAEAADLPRTSLCRQGRRALGHRRRHLRELLDGGVDSRLGKLDVLQLAGEVRVVCRHVEVTVP